MTRPITSISGMFGSVYSVRRLYKYRGKKTLITGFVLFGCVYSVRGYINIEVSKH